MEKKMLLIVIAMLMLMGNTAIAQKGNTKAQQHSHSAQIELNNGAKWKVDKPMMAHIADMEREVAGFDGTSTKDYKLLSKSLQQSIDGLTASCTMRGKAHDQLHKWLVPFIGNVKRLSVARNKKTAASALNEVRGALRSFHVYFE